MNDSLKVLCKKNCPPQTGNWQYFAKGAFEKNCNISFTGNEKMKQNKLWKGRSVVDMKRPEMIASILNKQSVKKHH